MWSAPPPPSYPHWPFLHWIGFQFHLHFLVCSLVGQAEIINDQIALPLFSISIVLVIVYDIFIDRKRLGLCFPWPQNEQSRNLMSLSETKLFYILLNA
jgi:hypothetical protein